MPDGLFQTTTWAVADGANTASPRIFLPPGGRLKWVSAGGTAGTDGPVRITIDLAPRASGVTISVATGWNRSPTDQSGGFAVNQGVDLPLEGGTATPFVVAFARNDTGAEVNLFMQVLAEEKK